MWPLISHFALKVCACVPCSLNTCKGWRCSAVVEDMPNACKILGSIPSTSRKTIFFQNTLTCHEAASFLQGKLRPDSVIEGQAACATRSVEAGCL